MMKRLRRRPACGPMWRALCRSHAHGTHAVGANAHGASKCMINMCARIAVSCAMAGNRWYMHACTPHGICAPEPYGARVDTRRRRETCNGTTDHHHAHTQNSAPRPRTRAMPRQRTQLGSRGSTHRSNKILLYMSSMQRMLAHSVQQLDHRGMHACKRAAC